MWRQGGSEIPGLRSRWRKGGRAIGGGEVKSRKGKGAHRSRAVPRGERRVRVKVHAFEKNVVDV